MGLLSSIGNGLHAVADVAARDTGHALNATNNLVNYQSFHAPVNAATPSPGMGLINYARSDPNNPATVVNAAQNGYNNGHGNQVNVGSPNTRTVYQPRQMTNADGSSAYASYVDATGNPVGTSAPQVGDPNLAAQYTDEANQLQGQLGYLDGQMTNGQNTITNSYGQALQQFNAQQALAQKQYDAAKTQNVQGYDNTRNAVVTQVRNQANALQRLLGMNGAGNSSAAYEQAPYAAALQGSQLINNAQSTYGKNAATTDNNWAQTQLSAKEQKQKLDQSKQQQETKLQQDIANSRATLLDRIRQAQMNAQMANGTDYQTARNNQAGLQSQIQTLLGQIQSLGHVQPLTFDPTTVQYNTPDMAQYSLNGTTAANANGTAPGADNVDNTFLSYLTDPTKKRDLYGNPIAA